MTSIQHRVEGRSVPSSGQGVVVKPRWDGMRGIVSLLMIMSISKIHAIVPFLAAARPAFLLALLCLLYAIANPRALDTGKLLRTWPAKVMAGLGVMACFYRCRLACPLGARERSCCSSIRRLSFWHF